ncbi:hypothetical protein PYW08_008679 [Mythimna loreyi]|uniref:Uncharacterized protein n=1 Tax=Mythimna loreyi TaxID=667449 RepID=A0ACC2Q940_9NEOP|nr:hypothetical protein PYW08_008679 [Mythimna loreyi]
MPQPEPTDSQFLLSGFLGASDAAAGPEAESRAALLRGLVLASLGRAAPLWRAPAAPVAVAPAVPRAAPAPTPPAAMLRVKPQPRTKEAAARALAAARQLPEGR